jgi:hypothetical protein
MDDRDVVEVPPDSLECVDCGGPCSRLGFDPEDGRWYEGDVVAYRCRDCLDRWDIVLGSEGS